MASSMDIKTVELVVALEGALSNLNDYLDRVDVPYLTPKETLKLCRKLTTYQERFRLFYTDYTGSRKVTE